MWEPSTVAGEPRTWAEHNRSYLQREMERIRLRLSGSRDAMPATAFDGPPPAIVMLARLLRLTAFERDVIVLCAGAIVEPAIIAALQPPQQVSFALALATLEGAHLDAISPLAPLRANRLVVLGPGDVLGASLSLDERVLHFVLGIAAFDERLTPIVASGPVAALVTGLQRQLAVRLAILLRASPEPLALQITAGSPEERSAVAAATAEEIRLRPIRVRAAALPASAQDLDITGKICDREALLVGGVIVVELDPDDGVDIGRAVRAFVERVSTVIVCADKALSLSRPSMNFDVPRSSSHERLELWRGALGADADHLGEPLERIAEQFNLNVTAIRSVVAASDRAQSAEALADELWTTSVVRARPQGEELALRIEPQAGWSDLVLPDALVATLVEIGDHLRYRQRVHETWGFARGASRGQAITALFCGPSGTGKTLAAEVIAREAKLDLYHVDLSQVVDKYVGETEKRLARVFDAAERGGAVLLFDEADALFGKRGEIERGTDRWANLEVSYLLQRMERYRGLAILTTNAKDAIDAAFLRRLRFVARFPYPDVQLREALWRRVFPLDAPTLGLEPATLARLQLTGANIKSVALKSAVHAAADRSPITMAHVLRAARSEFAKLDVPFPEAEVKKWGSLARAGNLAPPARDLS